MRHAGGLDDQSDHDAADAETQRNQNYLQQGFAGADGAVLSAEPPGHVAGFELADFVSFGPGVEEDEVGDRRVEVAALLGKHSNTVYGWVRSGALPSERIGNSIYIPKWALARLQAPPPERDEAA